ncbi:putative salicylate hydroxylase [Thozetella sp. PMI_491]|nr:putative salicylate hydroxylase [Thozetella sp. PMI_491]
MPSYQPRIAILGGGPSGLTLGLLLHKKGIAATIYELRSMPTAEELAQPSGVLDLHEESGLQALRECGIFDEFLTLTGDCTEATNVVDKNGELLWAHGGNHQRPEISRHSLIGLLLRHIPPDLIKWNSKVLAVSSSTLATGNSEITADLGSHGKHTFDFVIGADGAWSKARALVTSVKPKYSGSQYIVATATQITQRAPHLVDLIGSGTMFAFANRKGVVTHRGAQDSAHLDIVFEHEDPEFGKTNGWVNKTYPDAKETLLNDDRFYSQWGPGLRELLGMALDEEATRQLDAKLDIKGLYMLPVGHSWDSKPGVTLVGDAAHLMTPWAGEGVNLAMWDSLDLSRMLTQAAEAKVDGAASYQSALAPLIAQFEKVMFERAAEKAGETWRNKKIILGDDGSIDLANVFRRLVGGGPPPQ